MKKILIIFLCFLMIKAKGQNINYANCGTTENQALIYKLRSSGKVGPLPACNKARINIYFHFIHKDDGTGGFFFNDFNLEYDYIPNVLNKMFSNVKIEFNYIGKEDVNNTDIFNIPRRGRPTELIEFGVKKENSINLYVYDNENTNITMGLGIMGGNSAMISGRLQWNRKSVLYGGTVAHEIGHCLGLFHTFNGTACSPVGNGTSPIGSIGENIDGSNGDIAGDFVMDTPADPSIFKVIAGSCKNEPNLKNCWGYEYDIMGNTPYTPLTNNLLDYIPNDCNDINGNGFTQGQGVRMREYIANYLVNLLDFTKANSTNNLIITTSSSNICQGTTITLNLNNTTFDNYIWKFDNVTINQQNFLTDKPKQTTEYTVYALNNFCEFLDKAKIKIIVNDDVKIDIIGKDKICLNNSSTYQYNTIIQGSTSGTGIWSVSGTNASIDNFGNLTPINKGTVDIIYNKNSTNCIVTTTKTIKIIGNPSPLLIADYFGSTPYTINSLICPFKYLKLDVIGDLSEYSSYFWDDGSVELTRTLFPKSNRNYTFYAKHDCFVDPIPTVVSFKFYDLPIVDNIVTDAPKVLCLQNINIYNVECKPPGGYFTITTSDGGSVKLGNEVHSSTKTTATLMPNTLGNCELKYVYTSIDGCVVESEPLSFQITDGLLSILPITAICTDKVIHCKANIPGGVWSVDDPSKVKINPITGEAIALKTGNILIINTLDVCGSIQTDQQSVNIYETPRITGPEFACVGDVIKFESNIDNSLLFPPSSTNPYSPWGTSNSNFLSILNISANKKTVEVLVVSQPNTGYNEFVKYMSVNYNLCAPNEPLSKSVTIKDCQNISCSSLITNPIVEDMQSPNNIQNLIYENGNYSIQSDIEIKGNLKLKNCNVIIEPNKKLKLGDLANVEIENCHFYTCGGTWQGIEVIGKDVKLNINNCFIEDAEIGIYFIQNLLNTNNNNVINFSVRNSIFNRNRIGIFIENFKEGNASFPFEIFNNIFTCRDIPYYNNVQFWDNIETVKNTSLSIFQPYASIPNVYNSYYIDNIKYNENNVRAFLKDNINIGNYTNEKSNIGIYLNNVGQDFSDVNIKKIVIGKEGEFNYYGLTSNNTNIFDNLSYGIKSVNSNLVVNNCTFQKPVAEGVGIFATESSEWISSNNWGYNTNKRFIKINKPSVAMPSNAFFDMNTAIQIGNIDDVDISDCFISSNQNINALQENGKLGISIGNIFFDNININNNNIYNIRYPIVYGGSHEGQPHKFGNIAIDNNEIANEIPTLPLANSFVDKAIHLGVYLEAFSPNGAAISCNGNTITKAFNGISASGWKARNVSVIGNTVELVTDPIIAPNSNHYGIKMEGGNGSSLDFNDFVINNNPTGNNNDNIIRYNTITGSGVTQKNSGIQIALQTNTTIECNKVGNCQDGFRFYGNSPLTKFTDNNIYITNQNGVYLDQTIIGRQGNDGSVSLADACTSNNDWEFDASTWQGSGKNMIYNYYTVPSDAEFVVRSTGKFNPANGGYSEDPFQMYYQNNGLILATAPDKCTRCNGAPARIKSVKEILEEIAAGTILLPNEDAQQRLKVMQQQVYELVRRNPELAENSTDLQQFIYDNQWQSLDFIYHLGYFSKLNRMDKVNEILNFWLPTSSQFDDNYRTYYQWLLAMYNDPGFKPSLEEVWSYAIKCPITNGTIIYAYRNLYNALTRTINNFEDNCESNNPQGRGVKKPIEMIRLKQPKVKQNIIADNKLLIYPNPSSNFFNLKSNTIASISIFNTFGQEVLNIKVLNNEQRINTESLPNGIYVVKATDIKGKITNSKLIIQH